MTASTEKEEEGLFYLFWQLSLVPGSAGADEKTSVSYTIASRRCEKCTVAFSDPLPQSQFVHKTIRRRLWCCTSPLSSFSPNNGIFDSISSFMTSRALEQQRHRCAGALRGDPKNNPPTDVEPRKSPPPGSIPPLLCTRTTYPMCPLDRCPGWKNPPTSLLFGSPPPTTVKSQKVLRERERGAGICGSHCRGE